MSSNPYSSLKAAWHLDKIEALRLGRQVVPAQVQLILSDLCNQDCHFCAYRMSGGFSSEQFAGVDGEKNPNRMIPTVKAKEILDDCASLGVGAVQFTGGGEPTVHPDHLAIFEHAQYLGLDTALVTNGVLFRPGWERALRKMSWVRVSIDASNAEEYSKVRRVKPEFYERALANVTALAEEIAAYGSSCVLGVGYVITRENWTHLVDGVSRLRDTGAHNVRLSAMFSTQGADYYAGIGKDISIEIDKVKKLATDRFDVVDLYGDRIRDLVQHAPDYDLCGYQQFNTYIGGNLRVYRCCTTSYTKHGEVGDLSGQRLSSWFYSQQKHDAYANFNARSCETCQFNNQNRVINFLTGDPVHVNFV